MSVTDFGEVKATFLPARSLTDEMPESGVVTQRISPAVRTPVWMILRSMPCFMDFYDRLIDELLRQGIEPYATLYHWDLPQALEDKVGGWRSSETSKAFGDYAAHVAARITDRVKSIFTINEAGRFVNFGYGWGIDAPGLKLPDADVNQVRHHAGARG